MKNLTQYLKKTMLFFTPLLVLAFGLDYMADEGLKRTDHTTYKQWSRLYEEQAEADILILGNSRAACHVDPVFLGSCLSARAYNLGILGGYSLLQDQAYDLYRKHNSRKPSLIVLNVDWSTLYLEGRDFFLNKSDYLLWCTDPDWELIVKKVGYTFPEKYFPLLKYGKRVQFLQLGLYSYWGIEGYGGLEDKFRYNGNYLETRFSEFQYFESQFREIDGDLSTIIALFRQCRQEGIQVVCYYSPVYEDYRHGLAGFYQETYTTIDSLLSAWDIPFLDYSTLPVCRDTTCFRDCVHLNRRGAEWLTKRLACDIDSLERKEKIRWSR